jgi:hypothetical protein
MTYNSNFSAFAEFQGLMLVWFFFSFSSFFGPVFSKDSEILVKQSWELIKKDTTTNAVIFFTKYDLQTLYLPARFGQKNDALDHVAEEFMMRVSPKFL